LGAFRSRAPWITLLMVVGALLIGNAHDVLHFVLVTHRWCALHAQIEHVPDAEVARRQPPRMAGPMPTVLVSDPDDGVHGPDAGCVILASRQQHVAVLCAASSVSSIALIEASASCLHIGVIVGAPCLSFAPKRSPPTILV